MAQQLSLPGGNLFYIYTVLDLQTNQIIRNKMLNNNFIRALSALLDNTNANSEQIQEFQNTLLLVAESIASNHKILVSSNQAVTAYLIPVLLSKVNSVGAEDETRFLSLKIMTDILITLAEVDGATGCFDQYISELMPLAKNLLSEQSPVPFYGQRLLSVLIERSGVND
jgi:hypothetical protein